MTKSSFPCPICTTGRMDSTSTGTWSCSHCSSTMQSSAELMPQKLIDFLVIFSDIDDPFTPTIDIVKATDSLSALLSAEHLPPREDWECALDKCNTDDEFLIIHAICDMCDIITYVIPLVGPLALAESVATQAQFAGAAINTLLRENPDAN
jgi:hypothetical protein